MRRGAALCLPAVAALLLPAAPARAGYDPIDAGATRITFSPAFAAMLKANGVKLSASAPARLTGRTVSFPVSGGRLDPSIARGTIEHEGALVFRAGGHVLPMKALQLKTAQVHSPISAKLGGGKLKLAASARLTTARSGFGLGAKVAEIKLSGKVATRLDKKLGLRGIFAAGQLLGASSTDAQPETVAIEAKGRAELQLAPEFSAKLASLYVAVNPVFPAEHLGGPFTLPVLGGQMGPGADGGTLELAGSLEAIQQGGGQAFLRDPILDFGGHLAGVDFDLEPSPPNPGNLGRVSIADLSAALVTPEPKAGTIAVSDGALSLQVGTAQALNEAFAEPQGKTDVFKAGETLGTLSFTAHAQ
jgi:hypothetical protein